MVVLVIASIIVLLAALLHVYIFWMRVLHSSDDPVGRRAARAERAALARAQS